MLDAFIVNVCHVTGHCNLLHQLVCMHRSFPIHISPPPFLFPCTWLYARYVRRIQIMNANKGAGFYILFIKQQIRLL